MAINNFKRLLEEDVTRFSKPLPDIERNINGSIGLIKYIGQIIELYLPSIFKTILNLTGESTKLNDTPATRSEHKNDKGPSQDNY